MVRFTVEQMSLPNWSVKTNRLFMFAQIPQQKSIKDALRSFVVQGTVALCSASVAKALQVFFRQFSGRCWRMTS